jgi:glycosyltransferase involved in cell wall biosynthesis
VCGQTLHDIEIICIDDGSTDSCAKILEIYAKHDTRISVIHCSNGGYGKSVNLGIDIAKGEYIGIVEPDDWIEPEMYDSLYKIVKNNNVNYAKTNYYINENGVQYISNILEVLGGGDDCFVFPLIEQKIFTVTPSVFSGIYNKYFLKKARIRFLETPGASYQDTSFIFKVWALCDVAYISNRAYYHYNRDNPCQSVKRIDGFLYIINECEEVNKFLNNTFPLNTDLRKTFRHVQQRIYTWNCDRLNPSKQDEFKNIIASEYICALTANEINPIALTYKRFREYCHIASFYANESEIKISVIIPTYNKEEYVRNSIMSVMAQTLTNIEIVVIDDCSTDSTQNIIHELAAIDKRIRLYVNGQHVGVAKTRNIGLENARGDYIMFCDADDEFSIDICEILYKAVRKYKADLGVCAIDINYDFDAPETLMRDDAEYYRMKFQGLFPMTDTLPLNYDASLCNKIFNRALVQAIGLKFPDSLEYEDYYFCISYAFFCNSCYFTQRKLYLYNRKNSNSIMAYSLFCPNDTRAVQHWFIFEKVYEFLNNKKLLQGRMHVLRQIFNYCFGFAHSYSNHNKIEQARITAVAKKFLIENNLEWLVTDLTHPLCTLKKVKPSNRLKINKPAINILHKRMLLRK